MKQKRIPLVGEQYLVPFILITSLFFLWGFAHAILDVLNKHFQELLDITKAHSAFIQAMMYMGYFVMAVPAGLFISRFGYRREWFSGCCCTVSVRCCLFPGNTICHSICSCLPFLSSVVD